MAATFSHVVLGQREISALVFAYQAGVFDDVRRALASCNDLIECRIDEHGYAKYECDASFGRLFAPTAAWPNALDAFYPSVYARHKSKWDARLPLHLAVASGCMALTKRMVICRPDLASEDAIVLACMNDDLAMAELLLDLRTTLPQLHRCVNQSVPVQTTRRRDASAPIGLLTKAIARDDTRGLDVLRRLRQPDDDFVVQFATRENLTLALAAFPWFTYRYLADEVAGRGFLPLLPSLLARGLGCSRDAMFNAARSGHLDVVTFLQAHGSQGCDDAMVAAATYGHFKVVAFLYDHERAERSTSLALGEAIAHGHLDIVRFLIDRGVKGASPYALGWAAANGHLEMVQYLHRLGTFGCSVYAVDSAASAGHLDVITFLLTHRGEGCTRDKVVRKALKRGHVRTAEYLLSRGCPFPTSRIAFKVCLFAEPEMVDVLRLYLAHGGAMDHRWMEEACAANNLALVCFLLDHPSTRWGSSALERAIHNKRWDVVRHLLAHGAVTVSPNAVKVALQVGNLDLVTTFLERHPDLRNDWLLQFASCNHRTDVTRYLLAAGIGEPRECLVRLAGFRAHVTESNLLLPYCMDPMDHLDNIVFLPDLVALPNRRLATARQLLTPELLNQGRKAGHTIQVSPRLVARAATLLAAGNIVDWALTRFVEPLDGRLTVERLTKWSSVVCDATLQMQFVDMLSRQRCFEVRWTIAQR